MQRITTQNNQATFEEFKDSIVVCFRNDPFMQYSVGFRPDVWERKSRHIWRYAVCGWKGYNCAFHWLIEQPEMPWLYQLLNHNAQRNGHNEWVVQEETFLFIEKLNLEKNKFSMTLIDNCPPTTKIVELQALLDILGKLL
jgi:hypothetical protein